MNHSSNMNVELLKDQTNAPYRVRDKMDSVDIEGVVAISSFGVEQAEARKHSTSHRNPSTSRHSGLSLSYIFGDDEHDNEIVDDTKFAMHTSNGPIMTIFLLLNTMIGSGILNQPQVFATAGVVSSTIMLIVTALFTWLGIAALVDTGIAFNKFDFSELSNYAFGKYGEVLVDVCIAIGNFGALLSYMIVIGSTATDLIDDWGCLGESFKCSTYLYTPLIIFVFVVPVCCKRVFGELAFYSVISMISIGSIVLLTMIGGPIVGDSSGPTVLSNSSGFISQLGSIIFALSCSFASFHTFISLHNGTAALWRRVTAIAMTLGVIMLFVIGIAGYLSFKTSTEGIILDNFTGNYSDIFKIMLIIHLVLYIPVDFMTMRYSLVKLSGNPTGQVTSDLGHFLVTVALLIVPLVCVLLLFAAGLSSGNAFSLILDFSGGLAGSITSFVMPAAFYLKLMPRSSPLYWPCAVMLVLGIIIAFVVPITSIIQYA